MLDFLFRKRLNQEHKLAAVRVAKDAWAKSNGDKALFEQLVKEDQRTKMIDPMLIVLFIKLAMAVWDYFKNRNASVSAVVGEDDEAVILGAVRYYKG